MISEPKGGLGGGVGGGDKDSYGYIVFLHSFFISLQLLEYVA